MNIIFAEIGPWHTYTRLHRRLAYHHKSCSAWVPYTFQKREGVWGQTKELYPQRYFYMQILFLSSPPSLVVKWVKYKLEGVLQWFHHRALVQGLRKAPQLILDIPTINWPMSIAIDAKAPFIVLKGLPSLKTQASQYRALVIEYCEECSFQIEKSENNFFLEICILGLKKYPFVLTSSMRTLESSIIWRNHSWKF